MSCTIQVAKTKALISCAVIAQLICTYVFALAIIPFSQDVLHFMLLAQILLGLICKRSVKNMVVC